MKIRDGCVAHLRDIEAQNIRSSTPEGCLHILHQLATNARAGSIESVADIDSAAMHKWREGWTFTYLKRWGWISKLRSSLSFAATRGSGAELPLSGLRSPKADRCPILRPLLEEARALVRASGTRPRERALILRIRYSGLAVRDVASLKRSVVHADRKLVLRKATSDELVTSVLSAIVLAALNVAATSRSRCRFWADISKPIPVAKYWRERLMYVMSDTGVEGLHSYRMQDTFAVDLMLADYPMKDTSVLLVHKCVNTTERDYALWTRARRNRLTILSSEVHRQDPLLLRFTPTKPARGAVTAATSPAADATPGPIHIALLQGST